MAEPTDVIIELIRNEKLSPIIRTNPDNTYEISFKDYDSVVFIEGLIVRAYPSIVECIIRSETDFEVILTHPSSIASIRSYLRWMVKRKKSQK